MEVKDLQTEMQSLFAELKATNERKDADTQEVKNTIEKINLAMNEVKKQMEEMEKKANRTGFDPNVSNVSKEEQERKNAFYKFIREGKENMNQEERKALVQDATGDIIVPADLDKTVYRALQQLNVLRGLASIRNTKSDRVRRINMNELTVGWGKIEIQTNPKLASFESTLVPTEAYGYVEDAYGLTKIGEDELEDSDLNLEQYLADSFATAYANLEETAFLKGTGHANLQPEGILNGSTVTRFNTGAVGTLTADDLIKVSYEVPAIARKNGTYLVNPKIEMAMRLMKDSQGQYLWQPSLQAGAPSMFNGKAVYNVEPMDSTVATNNLVAVFGDVKDAYQILDRKDGFITRINELYINDGLIGFRYKRRVGGYVKKANALRVLKVQ